MFQYPIDPCPRAWQWPLHFQAILESSFAYSPLKKTEKKMLTPANWSSLKSFACSLAAHQKSIQEADYFK